MHTPLDIKNTPNCQPHPWHPSVIYVDEGWNGHRWWMAQTPFPPKDLAPYRDRYELPCIHFSDDGIHWLPIKSNPIDDIDQQMVDDHNYLSDPHLVLRNGILECYYRLSLLKNRDLSNNQTLLLRKKTTDGENWSSREVVADLRKTDDTSIWGDQIISPAIIWDGRQYFCWYVDRNIYSNYRKIFRTTSKDGIVWDKHAVCSIACDKTIDPWHIDVQYYNDSFQMIIYDDWRLYWFESKDGINFDFVSDILTPSQYFMDFYSEGLYRACSVKVNNSIWVYFSATNARRASLGLLKTSDRTHFEHVKGISYLDYYIKYIVPQISWKNAKRMVKHELRRLNLYK